MPTWGPVPSLLCTLGTGAQANEATFSGLGTGFGQLLLDRLREAPIRQGPILSLILPELTAGRLKVGLAPKVTLDMGEPVAGMNSQGPKPANHSELSLPAHLPQDGHFCL